MPKPSNVLTGRKKTARSRVSNGRDILRNVDGRSPIVRRYRDVTTAVLADQGGIENCSESRLQLIRRFAGIAVLAEETEADLANGKPVDIGDYATLCSTLVRLASRIGLNRHARELVPSVAQYLENISDNEAA
jgi:hypothetical protein